MNLRIFCILGASSFVFLAIGVPPTSHAAVGGLLYVYSDVGYTQLRPLDSLGRYPVVIGETIYIHIDDLTDVASWGTLDVSVGTPNGAIFLGTFGRLSGDTLPGSFHTPANPYVGDSGHPINWVVGDKDKDGVVDYVWPESTTLTIHYKYDTSDSNFVAGGPMTTTGHLHVIPEVAGPFAALVAMFGAYGLLKQTKPKGT